MATKTIPQLTLKASLTDASMFEIDDGVQSYRITATQIVTYFQTKELINAAAMIAAGVVTEVKIADLAVTNAKLAQLYISDLTAVTPVAADFVAISDTSDSGNKKKALVSYLRNAVYRSVVTTDSVGIDDETMKLSGASFTSTLPTAVGVTGKRYKYIHAGTSLTQVYTLATTSSQTIGGVASGSYALYTVGEVLEIESDGANWVIINHYTKTGNTSWTPTGTWSTNTTYTGNWRRDGMFVELDIKIALAGAPTSATLTVNTPSNIAVDTARMLNIFEDFDLGKVLIRAHGVASFVGYISYNSTTVMNVFNIINTASTSSIRAAAVTQVSPFTFANTDVIYLQARFPVAGWQP